MRSIPYIRNIYFFSAFGLFVYLILRAIYVPPVHDEAATFIHYIQRNEWMPYKAHWDANNHILNSFLSSWSFKLFGMGFLQLRLASLLFFPLFAVYVYRIGEFLKSKVIKIGFFLGMLGVHSLMEYFAYSRGYGMSMALLMAAIFYVLQYFRNFDLRKLWPFYIFSFLAVFANLTLFNSMVIMNGLILFSFLLKNKKWLIKICYFALGIIPLVIAATISMEMKKRGLLYYGADKSFYHVTLASLGMLIYGSWCTWLAIGFIVVAAIGAILLLAGGISEGLKNILFTHRWVFAMLLFGNVIATVLLQKIMHVNYPEDRTAMYFYFLLVMFFCFTLDHLNWQPLKYLALVTVIAPFHFLVRANTSHSTYWYYEHIQPNFYHEVLRRVGDDPASASIGGYNLMDMIWAYYNQQNGGVLNDIQTADYPSFYYDYLFLYDDENYQACKNDYQVLMESPYSHIRVLERKNKMNMELITSYTRPDHVLDTNEYFKFYGSDSLSRFKNLCIDIDCNIFCPDDFLFAYVSLGTFNNEEPGIHEWQALHHFQADWKGNDRFHHRIYITGIKPEGSRSVCYLWNPKHQPITLTNCKVKIYSFDY